MQNTIDVLIVDDSTAIRKILQRVLRQTDLPIKDIYEAGDGRQALEVLADHPVNLIFSDINMPNMDGLALLNALQSHPQLKSVPAVMITTEGSQATVMEAIKLGARGYVRKPFTPDQITDRLATLNLIQR